MKYAIALDVGGTFIKSALISTTGDIVNEAKTASSDVKTPEQMTALITRVIHEQMDVTPARAKLVGVGVGSPGPLDPRRGIIFFTPNLPFKKPFHILERLRARVKLPVWLQNDANVAALGEGWQGAGKGTRVLVMYTLGTGIGGGVLIDGKIFDGAHGQGAELGHFPLVGTTPNPSSERRGNKSISSPARGEVRRGGSKRGLRHCGAGHPGCFEAYANSNALVTYARQAIKGARINDPLDIYRLAQMGHAKEKSAAKAVFVHYGKILGVATAYALNVFNPEVILFGGAISGAWEFFGPALIKEAKRRAFGTIFDQALIKPAALGNRAGIFGAAKMVFDTYTRR